jgi:hypothetical protein
VKRLRVVLCVAAVAAVAAVLGGCRTDDLALRADDSLAIERPAPMSRVALPVTVRWKADGVRIGKDLTGPGPFFAVFVDRPPVAAGTGLRTLIDQECRDTRGCPDLAWLAERNVYVTNEPEVTISTLRDISGARLGPDGSHRLTVVLIDDAGVRVDERAASVEFEVAS